MPNNKPRTSSGLIRLQRVRRSTVEFSRLLRKSMTPAEEKLWALIRDRQCAGLKFRRQQIIYGFVADYYCEQLRLCVEVDGGIHDDPEQKVHDEKRTAVFNSRGIKTVRFRNDDILKHPDKVLALIVRLKH